jgi:diketogulonate reductase-like aldo/keto reductase
MILEEHFTLANGVNIPKLGLGTWRLDDGAAAQVVKNAIGIGYRHIDTAQAYENEHGVGEGVRASGIARDHVFVTTKLAAECKGMRRRSSASIARLRYSGSIISI